MEINLVRITVNISQETFLQSGVNLFSFCVLISIEKKFKEEKLLSFYRTPNFVFFKKNLSVSVNITKNIIWLDSLESFGFF